MKKWQTELRELTNRVDQMGHCLEILETDYRRDRKATATCECGRWLYYFCQSIFGGGRSWWFKRGDLGGGRAKVFCCECNTACRANGTTIPIPFADEEEADNEDRA